MLTKAERVNVSQHQPARFMLRFIQYISEQSVFYNNASHLKGSSALIVVYKTGLTSMMMQHIASTTHHPATVFLNKAQISNPYCKIRWFNQQCEIKRCGHGTLAAANYLLRSQPHCPRVFISNSNERFVTKIKRNKAQLELSSIESKEFTDNALLQSALSADIKTSFNTAVEKGYTVALIDENIDLKNLNVNISAIKQFQTNAIIVLKIKNSDKHCIADFRYFAPQFGVNEDNATGSAISVIAPLLYRLHGLNNGTLVQQSPRGALLNYTLSKHRVLIY
jgi:PhzF family phenazine biosynthesis protein